MAHHKSKSCPKRLKAMHWRKNKNVWTDTMFTKKLLRNPSLMTDVELADALFEYNEWRLGSGKYDWREDPVKECAEQEPPFSSNVLTMILAEIHARLLIGGELALGRFKNRK